LKELSTPDQDRGILLTLVLSSVSRTSLCGILSQATKEKGLPRR
jgi:hypothetical protein